MPSSELRSAADAVLARQRRERLRQHLATTAYWMDERFSVPGTRWTFGIDAIIGLVPVVGDLAGYAMGLWMVHEARAGGVPRVVLQRMLRNLGIEAVVGFVPLLGDIFDVAWRAHSRNRVLVERWLDEQDGTPLPPPRRLWPWVLLVVLGLCAVAFWLYPPR